MEGAETRIFVSQVFSESRFVWSVCFRSLMVPCAHILFAPTSYPEVQSVVLGSTQNVPNAVTWLQFLRRKHSPPNFR